MHDGDFTNIIAPVKTGATELAVMMAVAVQYGAEFMGMKAKRTDTLFINCDGSHKAVERSFATAINAFGKRDSYMQGPLLMDLSNILLNAEDGKQMEILKRAIDEKLEEYPYVKFIIIDSVSSLISGSEFDSKAVKPVILELRNIARKHKVALLYTIHTRLPGIEGIKDMIENPETTGAHYSLSDVSYALWQSRSDSYAFFLQAKDDMDIDMVIKMRRLPGINQVFVPIS